MGEIIRVYSDEEYSEVVATLDTCNDPITLGEGDCKTVKRNSDDYLGFMKDNCVYNKRATDFDITHDNFIGYYKLNQQIFSSCEYYIYTKGGKLIASVDINTGIIQNEITNRIIGYIDTYVSNQMDIVYAASMYVLLVIVPRHNIDYAHESLFFGDSERPKNNSLANPSNTCNSASSGSASFYKNGSSGGIRIPHELDGPLSTILGVFMLIVFALIVQLFGIGKNPLIGLPGDSNPPVTQSPTPSPVVTQSPEPDPVTKSTKPTLGGSNTYKVIAFEGAISEGGFDNHDFDHYAEAYGFNIVRKTDADLKLTISPGKKTFLRVFIYDSDDEVLDSRTNIQGKCEIELPKGKPGDQYKVAVVCEKQANYDTCEFKVTEVVYDPEDDPETIAKYYYNLKVKTKDLIVGGRAFFKFDHKNETIGFHIDNAQKKCVQLEVKPDANKLNIYVYDKDGNLLFHESELTQTPGYYDLPISEEYEIRITGVYLAFLDLENTIKANERNVFEEPTASLDPTNPEYIFHLDVREKTLKTNDGCGFTYDYTNETIGFHIDNALNKPIQVKVSPGQNKLNVFIFDKDGNLLANEIALTQSAGYYELPGLKEYEVRITGASLLFLSLENRITVKEIG